MIYVDLDDVLIRTHLIMEHRHQLLGACGIPQHELETAYVVAQGSDTGFTPEKEIEILRGRGWDVSGNILTEHYAFIDAGGIHFADAESFLMEFSRGKLVVLTRGNDAYQRRKADANGVTRRVSCVRATNGNRALKSDHVPMERGELSFFLDDSAGEIDAMKQARPWVLCIHMRPNEPFNHGGISQRADARCASLDEAIAFIKNHGG